MVDEGAQHIILVAVLVEEHGVDVLAVESDGPGVACHVSGSLVVEQSIGLGVRLSSGSILGDGIQLILHLLQQREHRQGLAALALADPGTKVSSAALGVASIILDAAHLASVDAVAVEKLVGTLGVEREGGVVVAHACSIGGGERLSSDEVSVSYTLLSF